MMDRLDNVGRLLDLMRSTFEGGVFKTFYYGDPEDIPLFNLPCIIVDMPSDVTARDAMSQDEVTETVLIKVVFDKRDDWTDNVEDRNTTLYRIREAIGMRKVSARTYETGTIKYAVRNAATDGLVEIAEDLSVEFSTVLRSGGTEPLITAEGIVSVPLTYTVDVDESGDGPDL